LEDHERLGLIAKDEEVKEEFIVRPLTPPRLKSEVESPDPLTFVGRVHPGFNTVEQGITERHQRRHQAFRNRRRLIKSGMYQESLEDSPITEQMEWESVEKGSPLWNERQELYWKLEIEKMFNPWDVGGDLSLERAD
jgi:hypothetical protein